MDGEIREIREIEIEIEIRGNDRGIKIKLDFQPC